MLTHFDAAACQPPASKQHRSAASPPGDPVQRHSSFHWGRPGMCREVWSAADVFRQSRILHRQGNRRLRDGPLACVWRALQTMQMFDRPLRMGRGAEYGALVFFQYLEPAVNIGCMIGSGLRRQGEIRT